jgi:hypothetical protein
MVERGRIFAVLRVYQNTVCVYIVLYICTRLVYQQEVWKKKAFFRVRGAYTRATVMVADCGWSCEGCGNADNARPDPSLQQDVYFDLRASSIYMNLQRKKSLLPSSHLSKPSLTSSLFYPKVFYFMVISGFVTLDYGYEDQYEEINGDLITGQSSFQFILVRDSLF